MSGCVQGDKSTVRDAFLHKGADLARGDRVLCAFDHQRGYKYPGEVVAVVGQECGACENASVRGVVAAEGLRQFVL